MSGLSHIHHLLTNCVGLQQMQWVIGSERAQYAQEARWWIPDADVYEQMITIDTIADIMGHLRGMPDSEVDRKLKEMQLERLRFTFQVHSCHLSIYPTIQYMFSALIRNNSHIAMVVVPWSDGLDDSLHPCCSLGSRSYRETIRSGKWRAQRSLSGHLQECLFLVFSWRLDYRSALAMLAW